MAKRSFYFFIDEKVGEEFTRLAKQTSGVGVAAEEALRAKIVEMREEASGSPAATPSGNPWGGNHQVRVDEVQERPMVELTPITEEAYRVIRASLTDPSAISSLDEYFAWSHDASGEGEYVAHMISQGRQLYRDFLAKRSGPAARPAVVRV